MQSPVLQGTVLICPVAGVPSAEGMFSDPRAAEASVAQLQGADVQFADLVPEDANLVIAEGMIPVWPLVPVPLPFVSALPEYGVTEVQGLETLSPADQKGEAGEGLSDDGILPLVTSMSGASLAFAVPMVDPLNPATEKDSTSVPTDPMSLGAPLVGLSAAPVMARTVLAGEWTLANLALPEMLALPDGAPDTEDILATGSHAQIERRLLTGLAGAMPVAVTKSPIVQHFPGEAEAPRPTETTLTAAEWLENQQQTPLPAPLPISPVAGIKAMAAVWAPDGNAKAEATEFDLTADTQPPADPQVAVAWAAGSSRTDLTAWPVPRPTALILRYEDEGDSGRIDRLTLPASDTAVPIIRTDLPKSGPNLAGVVQTNLLWQSPLLKARSAEETVADSDLIAPAFGASSGTIGGGVSIATLAETGRTTVPNLPHLAAGIASTLAQGQDGSATLTLSPEELGRVQLSFQPDNQSPDRLVVMLTFDRPETMDLFRRHADQLAEALRTAGYSGVQIGFGAGAGGDGTHQQAGQTPATVAGLDDLTLAAEGLTTPALRNLASLGALDLRL